MVEVLRTTFAKAFYKMRRPNTCDICGTNTWCVGIRMLREDYQKMKYSYDNKVTITPEVNTVDRFFCVICAPKLVNV